MSSFPSFTSLPLPFSELPPPPNLILASGPNPNLPLLQSLTPPTLALTHTDSNGFTPLLSAVQYNRHNIIDYLVTLATAQFNSNSNSNPDYINTHKDADGDGVLFHVETLSTAQLLVSKGARVSGMLGGDDLDVVDFMENDLKESGALCFGANGEPMDIAIAAAGQEEDDEFEEERKIVKFFREVRTKERSATTTATATATSN